MLKFAIRRLASSPGFAVVSLLMLALGIAMSTLAFSVTNGALLRPLPFPKPDRLVRVFTTSPLSANWPLAPGNALDMRSELAPLGEFGLFSFEQQSVGVPGEPPEQLSGLSMTADLLRLLGVHPVLGRDFLPDEDKPGKPPVVLLTNRFWRDRFAGNPGILGQPLRIDGHDSTIVGVLPPGFDDLLLWYGCKYVTPLTVWSDWGSSRSTRWLHVAGRLNPAVSLNEAQARLDALAGRLARDYPTEIGQTGLRVTDLGPSFATASVRTMYWLIVALASTVLTIACANLGGVQLARALGRRSELAIRVALGATTRDLLAVVAAESIVLAALGTALGVGLTYALKSVIADWLHAPDVAIDLRVLAFAAAAGVVAVLAFGLLPAWIATRGTKADALKESSRGLTPGLRHQRLKYSLVVAQIALTLVLVSAAASFVLGIRAFLHRDRGWQPAGLVAGEISLPARLADAESANPTFARRLKAALERIPGVTSVAVASTVPLYGYQHPGAVTVEGTELKPGREPSAYITAVDSAYFSVLGIRLMSGRLFPADWRRTDPPVAIVSASTARRLFGDGDAIGKRIRFTPDTGWHEIIGVVADVSMAVRFDGPVMDLQVYHPIQEPFGPMYNFVLKTPLPAMALERQIRRAVSDVDADLVAARIGDVAQVLESLANNTPMVPILVVFAAAGLSIAITGLYGVMSQLTLQRRREIGVRIALGADYRRIVTMVLGYGGRLLAAAILIGFAGTFAVNAVLRHGMPRMPALGVPALLAIGAGLALVGLLACYLPSHRAARLNAVEVLRAE